MWLFSEVVILRVQTFKWRILKLTDNWINRVCIINDCDCLLPQSCSILHCCISVSFVVCSKTLCSAMCCRVTEQATLNTTIMVSVKMLQCCCFFCCSLSCPLEFHCCDFYDLSRYVKVECFVFCYTSWILIFGFHFLPDCFWSWDENTAKLAYSLGNK